MGKKKKQVPMTDEERLAFEEKERLLEAETRKKKENILARFLKDKLMHEERATHYNTCKINLQWRKVMQKIKARELRDDIELLKQTFDRVIDKKDMVIKVLAKELLEAEEMYAMAYRSHLQTVDRLLDLHKQRLETMTREYCLHLEMICQEFDIERALSIEHYHLEMNGLDDIIFAIELGNDNDLKEVTKRYESNDIDLKNKCIENRQALRNQLETKIEDLWVHFRQMLQKYNESSEERKAAYDSLRLRDEKRSLEIDLNMRKLKRLQTQISYFKSKLQLNAKIYVESTSRDDQEDDVFNRVERVRLVKRFHAAKAEMEKIRVQSREKLTRLTMASNEVIKRLKKQKEKGTFILKFAEICSRLESEEEKILPFYTSSLTEEEDDSARMASGTPHFLPLRLMNECSGLQQFWKRYNKVLLDKLCISKEIQTLTQENHRLKEFLKIYLDSISINVDTLKQDNPLLMVNRGYSVQSKVPPDTNTTTKKLTIKEPYSNQHNQ